MNEQKVILKNRERRWQVIQLTRAALGSGLHMRRETVIRANKHKDGTVREFQVKLKHPPVLRIPPLGETEPLDLSVLKDPQIQKSLASRPPRLIKQIVEPEPTPPARGAKRRSKKTPSRSRKTKRH